MSQVNLKEEGAGIPVPKAHGESRADTRKPGGHVASSADDQVSLSSLETSVRCLRRPCCLRCVPSRDDTGPSCAFVGDEASRTSTSGGGCSSFLLELQGHSVWIKATGHLRHRHTGRAEGPPSSLPGHAAIWGEPGGLTWEEGLRAVTD